MALGKDISSDARSLAEAFVRLAPDPAIVIDEDGDVLAANDLAAGLYERTERELTSMNATELLAADETLEDFTTESREGPTVSVHLRRDGQPFAAETSVRGLDADDSRMFAVSIRDVERCYDPHDELRLARLALDAAWDGVIMHTPEGEMVYFNTAAASSLGYTHDEFEALGPWAWMKNTDPRVRIQRMEELQRTGELSFISHGEHKDGTEMFLDVHARWLNTPSGPLIVSVSRDVTDKMQAQEMLREMAFHDPLTGLANRALLDDRLEVAIGEASRHGDLLGIAYLDIDDFKPVNDSFGHDVGDQVLETIGRRLGNLVRDHDTVARMGGDEFVAVFTRLSSEAGLERAASKLLRAIRQPIEVEGVRVLLTASCGLAMFDPAEDDERSLLMKADLAMYEAKRSAHMTFREKVTEAGGDSRPVKTASK
ncbi:MAG: diguanylate cyclase [Coriobacteriales bacterium]|nr:diguanylate cyclase [Coriobacteriales bacterium]